MKVPTEPQIKERIGTFMTQALAQGSETRPYPHPEYFGMEDIVSLSDWAEDFHTKRALFVFDPVTELMSLWVPTSEDAQALGHEVREELDSQERWPFSHRWLVLYTRPQPVPWDDMKVYYGAALEETQWRDDVAVCEIAVYEAHDGSNLEGDGTRSPASDAKVEA